MNLLNSAGAAFRFLPAALVITATFCLPTAVAQQASASAATPENLGETMEAIRKQLNLPGAAGVVMRNGKVIAEGVAGVRRLGAEDKIQIDDRFGIGSCTKRMTGALIGRLIDQGKLGFDSKLSSLLPDVSMRDEYRDVTVAQLLAFTGGIAAYERIGPKITPQLFDTSGSAQERQTRFIKYLLQEAPAGPAGKESHYSNASYALVAYIASRIMGKNYETLVDEQVFRPLGLDRTGWGRPWSATRMNEPWLHVQRPEGYVPEPDVIRPPEVIFSAAGGAHMSVRDLARFADYEMAAAKGKDALLKAATSARWQNIEGRPSVGEGVQAGGTPWLSACYAIWPAENMVAAIAVNGGSLGDQACNEFVRRVRERYKP